MIHPYLKNFATMFCDIQSKTDNVIQCGEAYFDVHRGSVTILLINCWLCQ